MINANGTCQSILKWGKNEGLGEDQQTAFMSCPFMMMH
jgi:hypothetical protein